MQLKTQPRTILGKKVKTLRRGGLIPAELYGRGISNKHLTVAEKEFSEVFKKAGYTSVINLVTQNEEVPVIISGIQKNPVTGKVLNVDFHQVRMDERIGAKVPIKFIGTAPAAKKGFIVVKVLDEIEIEALPHQIPNEFEVDLSGLEKLDDHISAGNLKLPKEIELITPADTVIVTISEKEKEEVEVKPVQETPAAAETPTEEETPPNTQ